MKIKYMILVLALIVLSAAVFAQKNPEPYFSQVVTTPDKTSLNFNVFVFHHKYRWIESKTEGKYSVVSLVIQNDGNAKALNWRDYKIYLLLKNGRLFHNYTTTAKSGNYNCRYTVEPGAQHVQLICFSRKFEPEDVERAWIKMTHANFISLSLKSLSKTSGQRSSQPDGQRIGQRVNRVNYQDRRDSGMAEARTMLSKFLLRGADHYSMTRKLRPTDADYRAYFVPGSWQKAKSVYDPVWRGEEVIVKPNQGQTELLLWRATVTELDEGTGDSSHFPGGYKHIMKHIRPGHTIYRFKFVQPGRSYGMAFDGLVYMNGRWVLFPKPWRVFR